MDNPPTFDRGILIPIVLGGLSIIGIIIVLWVGRTLNSPPPVSASPSVTAFQYVFLGTVPAITTPLTEESGIPFPTDVATEPSVEVTPIVVTTPPSVSSPIILTNPNTTGTNTIRTPTSNISRTNTIAPSRSTTPTFTSTPSAANTYDDTDSRLSYTPGWLSQSGVSGAYNSTLHISNTDGDSMTFTFTGPEIHVFYQAGPSLGSMTITVDGLGGPAISQAQSQTQIREWTPDNLLSATTHLIIITHSGGGSINIDSLVVPGPTPTPTRTPSPTQS